MIWYKGMFAGFAPIYVGDPYGDCMVRPRHIGHVLFPIAEVFVQGCNLVLSLVDAEFTPHFPISYDDKTGFHLE